MYKACVSFASSNQPETMELVRWMNTMNLDFLNMKILQSVDPVEIMVRGSLDFGVGVIISFDPQDTRFDHGKRVIEMSYSSEQEAWLLRRSSKPKYTNENDYARLFRLYGVRHDEDQLRYATKILAYEEQLRQIEKDTINMTQKQFIGIYDLGEHTAPHVTGKDWENLFYKYTEGTYKASHPIWTSYAVPVSLRSSLITNTWAKLACNTWLLGASIGSWSSSLSRTDTATERRPMKLASCTSRTS
nr:uncharacterized protein LOC119159960 [Rhipicephalus microplus]